MSFTRNSVLMFVAAGCLIASPLIAEGATKRKASRAGQPTGHTHGDHRHVHGPGCGHTPVVHGDHVDYLHQGHLHNMAGGRVQEHRIPVSAANPATHSTATGHIGLDPRTTNEAARGWQRIPHGNHTDWLADGYLLHPHGDHYDVHGRIQVAGQAGSGMSGVPHMTAAHGAGGAPMAPPVAEQGGFMGAGAGYSPAWNPCYDPCYNPCW